MSGFRNPIEINLNAAIKVCPVIYVARLPESKLQSESYLFEKRKGRAYEDLEHQPPMTAQLFIILFCILWVLMCGRMWWMIDRRNVWQRRAIAIGAGLGAAMFYLLGTFIWSSVQPQDQPLVPKTGDDVRISPMRTK